MIDIHPEVWLKPTWETLITGIAWFVRSLVWGQDRPRKCRRASFGPAARLYEMLDAGCLEITVNIEMGSGHLCSVGRYRLMPFLSRLTPRRGL